LYSDIDTLLYNHRHKSLIALIIRSRMLPCVFVESVWTCWRTLLALFFFLPAIYPGFTPGTYKLNSDYTTILSRSVKWATIGEQCQWTHCLGRLWRETADAAMHLPRIRCTVLTSCRLQGREAGDVLLVREIERSERSRMNLFSEFVIIICTETLVCISAGCGAILLGEIGIYLIKLMPCPWSSWYLFYMVCWRRKTAARSSETTTNWPLYCWSTR